mgnify:CR=1 FL=1
MRCTLMMVSRLLKYPKDRMPVELMVLLEPYREGDHYRADVGLREMLCGLLEERAGCRNPEIRNALQNWRQLARMVRSGEYFTQVG